MSYVAGLFRDVGVDEMAYWTDIIEVYDEQLMIVMHYSNQWVSTS